MSYQFSDNGTGIRIENLEMLRDHLENDDPEDISDQLHENRSKGSGIGLRNVYRRINFIIMALQ